MNDNLIEKLVLEKGNGYGKVTLAHKDKVFFELLESETAVAEGRVGTVTINAINSYLQKNCNTASILTRLYIPAGERGLGNAVDIVSQYVQQTVSTTDIDLIFAPKGCRKDTGIDLSMFYAGFGFERVTEIPGQPLLLMATKGHGRKLRRCIEEFEAAMAEPQKQTA